MTKLLTATAAVPRRPSKAIVACYLADLLDLHAGRASRRGHPSRARVAALFGLSVTTVGAACRRSAEEREQIKAGLRALRPVQPKPAPVPAPATLPAMPTTMDEARSLLAELAAAHGTDGILGLLAEFDTLKRFAA
jgi:hypothetical protein